MYIYILTFTGVDLNKHKPIFMSYKNVLKLPVTSIRYHILRNIEMNLTIAVVIFYILGTQNVKKTQS